MKHVMVRYTVRPERAQENVQLIQRVFEKLQQNAPEGLAYASYCLEDGVTFVHVASVADSDNNPLRQLGEFNAFTSTIRDRTEVAPVTTTLAQIGHYTSASLAHALFGASELAAPVMS